VRSTLLTSAINDIREGVGELLRNARDGQLPAGNYFGRAELAPFHDLEGQVPAAVVSNLAHIREGLASGQIQVDVPYRSP